jgi:CBS domain-containing protein
MQPNPRLVHDWMSTPVVVVDPDSSVSYALTLMRRRGIHSVVIDSRDESLGYGIITSTDISVKIIGGQIDPAETHVSEIMSAPLVMVRPNWTLKKCSSIMQSNKFHHLPVCDENDEIIGMISDTDIFMAAEEIGWAGMDD